jgi:hypothetical protein
MSSLWMTLKREIGTLRKHFLPNPFNPLGVYGERARVHAHTRAFLVLSHAEIESYLEGWAKEIARASEIVWNRSGRVVTPLACLLSSLGERIVPPTTLSTSGAKDSQQKLADAITKVFQRYYKLIKDNNGVREQNVLSLFGPLGVQSAAFSPTFLPTLDALGVIRGAHAHNSAKAVASVLDPETEHSRIDSLLTDMIVFDNWLTAYKRKVR